MPCSGMDVSHPGPGVHRPSFASMVWSVDRFACQYRSAICIQHPRQEIVDDIAGMMKVRILMVNGAPCQ